MDFLNPLRLRAIFGGHYPMDEKPPVDIMGQPSARDIFAPVNQDTENTQQPIQPQQDDAMKRFMMSLNEMPTREQGKPSNWRKVGAGIVGGFNGMDKGNEFLNRPYTEKIDDWKLKSGTLGRAAELERLNNSQISRDEYNDMMIQWRNADLGRKTDEGQVRLDQGQQRIDQGNAKLRLEQFKLEHPDYDLKQVPGGNWVFFNPKNPTEPPIDTGIDAGTLSQADAINLRGQWAMRAAAVPRTVNTTGTTTTIEPASNTAPKPAEEKVRLFNRAQQVANLNPDLAKYIIMGQTDTNEFTIDPKTPPEIQQMLQGLIYQKPGDISLDGAGTVKSTTSRQSTSVSTRGSVPSNTSSVPKQRKLIPGTNKYAVSTDGGKTWKAE